MKHTRSSEAAACISSLRGNDSNRNGTVILYQETYSHENTWEDLGVVTTLIFKVSFMIQAMIWRSMST